MLKKILIIEDEATQLLLLESRFTARGFTVFTAVNGEEGLRKAASEKPDLILMDMILPGMTGLETCQRLQESGETKHIPVLLVTASGMRDLEDRCKQFGIAGCLMKPYQISELFQKIETLFPSIGANTTRSKE
jgi:CheY-like chemotaxis protein